MSVRDGKVKLMLSAKDSARKLEIEKAQRKYDVACREHTVFIGSLPAKKKQMDKNSEGSGGTVKEEMCNACYFVRSQTDKQEQ